MKLEDFKIGEYFSTAQGTLRWLCLDIAKIRDAQNLLILMDSIVKDNISLRKTLKKQGKKIKDLQALLNDDKQVSELSRLKEENGIYRSKLHNMGQEITSVLNKGKKLND